MTKAILFIMSRVCPKMRLLSSNPSLTSPSLTLPLASLQVEMKSVLLFVVVAFLAAVSATEVDALSASNVPDVQTLQAKFGTFEQVIRARGSPAVLRWLDTAPSAFDTANAAWGRSIMCTKNLADNAAVKVYGAVSHARAVAKNLIERSSVSQFQTFSDPRLEKASKPVDPAVINKNLASKLEKAETKAFELYKKKLSTCFDSQRNITATGVKFAAERQRTDVFAMVIPAGAAHPSADATTQLTGAFDSLQKASEKILRNALRHAASAAQGAVLPASTPAALAFPSGAYRSSSGVFSSSTPAPAGPYCGAKRTCMNGGVCTSSIFDLSGRGECACPPQWTGTSCTQMRDSCSALNIKCANGGACVTEHGAWRCACPVGFGGLYCEDNSVAAAAAAAAESKKAAASVKDTPAMKLARLQRKLQSQGFYTNNPIAAQAPGVPVHVAVPAGTRIPTPRSTVAAVHSHSVAHNVAKNARSFHRAAAMAAAAASYGYPHPHFPQPPMHPAMAAAMAQGVPPNAVIAGAGVMPHPYLGAVPAVTARMVPAGSLSKPANKADAKKAEEAKKKAEEEAKKKAEEEAKKKAEEAKKTDEKKEADNKKADEEAKKKNEEAHKKAAEEAKKKAEAEAKNKKASFVELESRMDVDMEADLEVDAAEFGLGSAVEADTAAAGEITSRRAAEAAASVDAEPEYFTI